MPVIVVGADTPLGEIIMDALLPRQGEVRAFVSSPAAAASLKQRGVKVALGDVSDGSHVGGAALNAFCAVLVETAAVDDRERSFATDAAGVLAAWVEGLNDAKVVRTIFVGPHHGHRASLRSASAVVDPDRLSPPEVAERVAALEDAADLADAQ
jgi:putative NADH-flavin reductase